MKFVIVSPRQYAGGPIVLHALCKYITQLGYDASIFYSNVYVYNKHRRINFWISWILGTIKDAVKMLLSIVFGSKLFLFGDRFNGYVDESVKGCKRKILPFVDNNTIVIYPEIMYGNPLKSEKVVRWFLYHNRYENSAYDEKDLFICYRKIFNDNRLNPNVYMLRTPYFDLNKYKQTNFGERKGKCYILRKGKNRIDCPKDFDGIVIDNLSENDKVEVFNKCEICISYDTQTAYSSIAALCGCISVVIPEVGKSKKDYRRDDEPSYGIAWGISDDELDFAKKTRHLLLERYMFANNEGLSSTKEFLDLCNKYFFRN